MNSHSLLLSLILLIQSFTFAQQNPNPILSYFPSGFFSASDVTSIKWAHAVNSQQALNQVLADPSIQMIEADVSKGRLNISGEITPIDFPVMAHPPNKVSDLSLLMFMDQIINFNKDKSLEQMKGIKLDFKDYFSATLGISNIGTKNQTANGTDLLFPIWLNADILKGPVEVGCENNTNCDPKITPQQLFTLHSRYLPEAVLSLGWTTRFDKQSNGEIITNGIGYSRQNIQEMIHAIKYWYPEDSEKPELLQNLPITFALRANLAVNSIGEIMYLLNFTSSRATVTLWTGADDPKVEATPLTDFFKVVGRQKSFVDLPYSFKENSAGILSFNLLFIGASCSLRYLMCNLFNN